MNIQAQYVHTRKLLRYGNKAVSCILFPFGMASVSMYTPKTT